MSRGRFVLRLLAVLGPAILTACSLLLSFDPEGQPCDEQGNCSEGYTCTTGNRCTRQTGCGGGCPSGYQCRNNETCVASSCEVLRCPVGLRCLSTSGIPTCSLISEPDLGHPCRTDSDCQVHGAGRVCYLGTIPQRSGLARPGVCLEGCPTDGGACRSADSTCESFFLGRDAGGSRLCVPPDLVHPCRTDQECGGEAPTCSLFDHPQSGPLGLCDKPLVPGVELGQPCSLSPDAGTLCGNGLCIPFEPGTGQQAVCSRLCDTQTCGADPCALVEFKVSTVQRHIPMCLNKLSACQTCATDSVCTADAPRCTAVSAGVSKCLSSCTPTAGTPCPLGNECRALDAGYRCVPLGGGCP